MPALILRVITGLESRSRTRIRYDLGAVEEDLWFGTPDSPQEPSAVRGGAVTERPQQPLHGHGTDDDRNSLRSA